MRRAFIGVSGPLAYCYKKQVAAPIAPNPILEDSLGLLVLYDELLFLYPDLCPQNMRQLPYVQFLSDHRDFKTLMPEVVSTARSRYELHDARNKNFKDPFKRYEPALAAVTKQPYRVRPSEVKFVPDNHGRSVEVASNTYVVGSSANFQNVVTDWAIREAFRLDDCEVVSNSANSVYYETLRPLLTDQSAKASVGHALVVRGLPNYLDSDGPYHPCLEELRNHKFVEEARKHIDSVVRNSTKSEVDDVAAQLTAEAEKLRRSVFEKYLDKESMYKSSAVAGLSEAISSLLPGAGLLKDLVAARTAEKQAAAIRWSGFVADVADGNWTHKRLL